MKKYLLLLMFNVVLGQAFIFSAVTNASTIALNGGNSSKAECTELLRFDGYADIIAAGVTGQSFKITLGNGDTLSFILKKYGQQLEADTAPSWAGATFGRLGYTNSSGKIVMYQKSSGLSSQLNMANIVLRNRSGAIVPDYTICIYDGGAIDSSQSMDFVSDSNKVWYFWDSITPLSGAYARTSESGLGTDSVAWLGSAPNIYANRLCRGIAVNSPAHIRINYNSHSLSQQGIVFGIKRIIVAEPDTFCSGYITINPINAGSGTLFTWSLPDINPPGSVTGATAQSNWTSSIIQNLTNNTNTSATLTYTITSTGCLGTDTPFTAVVVLKPGRRTENPQLVCNGAVSIELHAVGSGYWLQWQGNPSNASIATPNADTTLITGLSSEGLYRFLWMDSGGCTDTFFVQVDTSTPGNIFTNTPAICSTDTAEICAPSGSFTYHWNYGDTTQCIHTSNAGNYYVTVTDVTGCSVESNHVAISAFPVSSISVSVNGDTMKVYDQTDIQWYNNGVAINGATSDIYIGHEGGNYQVEIIDSNGCRAISNPIVLTGVEDLKENYIAISPNPTTKNYWEVTLNSDLLLGEKYSITDLSGKVMFSERIVSHNFMIAADLLSKGIYFFNLRLNGRSEAMRLVKN